MNMNTLSSKLTTGTSTWYEYMYSTCTTVQLECLGIPSQCFFSPKMSDSGGLQDALQYCTNTHTSVVH